ncbi:unnamed protein product [Medioppia subpectinata]|uniref:Transmembrane protein 135 N-terminal domain-containing protein n=1 Tax=Medioppia subpectinata TaxID=1979941 RepID=A0A7R9KSM4_9ACAR|nr:unnamed protein product [Medioppia subpectinata]CAG2109119.1 unnamed protein product [Medioppia subpectinata]
MPEWALPYNCYEIGHTWNPNCDEAALDVCKFYYTLCSYLPVFVSSLLAILIEKRSRRGALAVYCANIASETVYRMLINRHIVKPIARGEVLIFTYGYGRDPVCVGLKVMLGREKHPKCNHRQRSCVSNSLRYFMGNFAIGWTAQVLMNTLMRPKRLIRSPKTVIISSLTDSNNVYFGLFLGSFSAVFKSVNCLLRRFTNTSQDWHSLVAALCAGPTMYLSSNTMNTTIALYLLWKSIEMLYLMAVRKGWLGYKDQTIMLLYAMSTAQLAYVTIMEPRAMRPSYLKFIDKITGHKMSSFNRTVLDVFGTGSSLGYEHNVFPNLCPNHTTRQFKENVINWIIS